MSDPKIQHDGTTWTIELDDESYRVVTWNAPHLVLARGDEVRHLFVGATDDHWVVGCDGRTFTTDRRRRRSVGSADSSPGHDDLSSPMPGKVLEVLVAEGDAVSAGQRLMILEAMKMESPLRAPHDSVVTKLHVGVGDSVGAGDVLIELDAPEVTDA